MSQTIFDLMGNPSAVRNKPPNFTRMTLEKKSGYFVVKVGDVYQYYKVKIRPEVEGVESPLFWFEQAPGFIREGLFIYTKKVYLVTVPDLVRGIIRISREIKEVKIGRPKRTARSTSSNDTTGVSEVIISTASGEAVQSDVQSTAGDDAELQLIKQADIYLADQIQSLLNPCNTEEEDWCIADPT